MASGRPTVMEQHVYLCLLIAKGYDVKLSKYTILIYSLFVHRKSSKGIRRCIQNNKRNFVG
jgi:hypothetical protein